MASLSSIEEVVAVEERQVVQRDYINDVAFILPLAEVESGLFYMSGASNTFFTMYALYNRSITPYRSTYYFGHHHVEPFTVQLFHSMNHLAQHLKKVLFHQREADVSARKFRLFFSKEAFNYLSFRLKNTCLRSYLKREQATTLYYDSLAMEATTITITKNLIRIISTQSLIQLRKILGSGIGLGLSRAKPTKRHPIVTCTIGCYLTSVELSDNIPAELAEKPLRPWAGNVIDFIYSEESCQLSAVV
jgi:hypothetical protein